jgi:uridylate kinase
MGMLATLINAVMLRDGLERAGARARVFAPHAVANVAERYERDAVVAALAGGAVVVFGGGTGQPFLTTDTCAALRAAQIGAGELLKASTVDGVYSADPRRDPAAHRFDRLTFDQAVEGRYGVMDAAAFALCREQRIPIRIFDGRAPGALAAVFGAQPPGTLVGG